MRGLLWGVWELCDSCSFGSAVQDWWLQTFAFSWQNLGELAVDPNAQPYAVSLSAGKLLSLVPAQHKDPGSWRSSGDTLSSTNCTFAGIAEASYCSKHA